MDRSRTRSHVPTAATLATAPGGRRPPGARTPRQVLARIVPDDPLGVRARVARRLARRCLLLDADRVHLRALARVAVESARGALPSSGPIAGPDAGPDALDACVDAAIADVLEERERTEGAFEQLAAPLGIAPDAALRACLAFDALSDAEREAFWLLAVETLAPDELARRTDTPLPALVERARTALATMLEAEQAARPRRAPRRISAAPPDSPTLDDAR